VKLRVVALAWLLIACTQPGVAQAPTTPGPTVSPTPTISPAGPPVAGDLPLIRVDFSCRLPVSKYSGGGDYATYTNGFIAFPAAAFSPDPNGGIHSRYIQQDFATDAAPVLYGAAQDGPPTYDLAQHRWVPASSAQLTADGGSYAYSIGQRDGRIQVHVADVATATEKAFDVSQPERAQVVDFGAAGVYLLLPSALGGAGEGVWLLNPTTGAVQRQQVLQQVMAVRDGYAWVGRIDPRSPLPQPPEGTVSNSIVRLDLQSGAETAWYYRAGATLWLYGFDSRGKPLIGVGGSPNGGGEIRLVEQPGSQGVQVYAGGLPLSGPQGDGDRIWFSGAAGIYLYTPARGLRKVFAYSPDPIRADHFEAAGFCR
jgi:hypothetical protein